MATIRPSTVPTKRLASAITSSASSFQLTDILGWDAANLTSASFGTKAYGVFRDATNSHIELFEFDPSTIASSSITILLRGLKFDGDLTTEVSGNKRSWTKGTLVELGTHVPQLFRSYVDILEAQTIAGAKTFSSVPLTTGGSPTVDNELARKAYVDAVAAGGSGIPNRVVVSGTAGETITAGNLVYLKVSDGRWWKCDADTAATVDNIILGLAQGAGTAAAAITSGVLLGGLDSNQTGLTTNTVYYASNTAGAISTTAGTTEVTVGYSQSTTTILFAPRYNQVLTESQQDFLDAAVNSTDWYAASATGTDAYAITVSPAITAYASGQRFRFLTDVANTGACTLNVSGLGAKTIKKLRDQDTATGDIEATQIVEVVYDGTNFQMTSQIASETNTDVQEYSADNTWTKPTGAKRVLVQAWAGGGGGGKGASNGGGGGGGEYRETWFDADDLSSTEAVVIGQGGALRSTTGTGNSGTNTTFGGRTMAFAAAGGESSPGSTNISGGAAGAPLSSLVPLWGTVGAGVAGGAGQFSGGGGGADTALDGKTGGNSIYGGGGGGGCGTTSNAAGGTSTFGGAGSAGVKNASAAAGSVPSGGGGGNNGTGNSGAGGNGKMVVTTFR